MVTIRPSRPDEGQRAVAIWRAAVDATHDFLSAADKAAIDAEVRGFLPDAPLLFAVNAADYPLGFMMVEDGQMQALFIDPAQRGTGVGRALVAHALAANPGLKVDVNEQNGQAIGFYERMGFRLVGRSELDDQGRPYPLLHLAHRFGV